MMRTHDLTWADNDTPKSTVFDDVYYNPANGLEESTHVFIDGNNLTNRWQRLSYECFTVAELGFGTGLNFMLTWQAFDKAETDAALHFISIEKYPLAKQDIAKALAPWQNVWGTRLKSFLNYYNPLDTLDIQLNDTVRLTVYFEDVTTALPRIEQTVDAWYLDGFAPSKNADMWSDTVFAQMARLSRQETSFSTFTAAGFVKRGLHSAGFDVQKRKGYGRKKESLYGTFKG